MEVPTPKRMMFAGYAPVHFLCKKRREVPDRGRIFREEVEVTDKIDGLSQKTS